ncbi:hypothetical protein [Streptosporangium sp. NPDC049644]|uniref:hypothetical protein n=1 Tax=Streptosporangium sp. NPDC049644 TaxID=3155507 RepID=UPI00343513A2
MIRPARWRIGTAVGIDAATVATPQGILRGVATSATAHTAENATRLPALAGIRT